jgi:molybdenum cofactor cytidylyltransferase
MFVTGIVLAAGASRRLGRPKQLLPYDGSTLLDATLGVARSCGFDQLLVTIGGAADAVRQQVDLSGTEVVEAPEFASGCGSSIRSAVAQVDPRSDGVVLLLGDQPGIAPSTVQALVERGQGLPIGICRYRDGVGHPFWFDRSTFVELGSLKGDKAVWKLMDSGDFEVGEVAVYANLPLDVDTWDDYRDLLESSATTESR